MRTSKLVYLLCTLLFSILPATADVIYDNGVPDLTQAWASDFDGNFSSSYFEQADDFQLQPGQTTITDVHWWGVYSPGNTPGADDFTIRIFEDNGGVPNLAPTHELTNLAVSRADTGADLPNPLDVYAYSVDVTPITLSANTTYWISILNDTTSDIDDDWYWAQSNVNGNRETRNSDGQVWSLGNGELAFYLTVIPEPASMTLLGLGVAGLAIRMRRRRE